MARVKADNAFVRKYAPESLRESLTLDYASYILALAMGAGKTILMGSIVATEFALAMEYPDGPFVNTSAKTARCTCTATGTRRTSCAA